MAKKERIANDPMETRLMALAATVHKAAVVLMVVVLAGAILLGMALAAGDLLVLAAIILPAVVLAVLLWLADELVCVWLENQAEMHCYARTQTEILLENGEKE